MGCKVANQPLLIVNQPMLHVLCSVIRPWGAGASQGVWGWSWQSASRPVSGHFHANLNHPKCAIREDGKDVQLSGGPPFEQNMFKTTSHATARVKEADTSNKSSTHYSFVFGETQPTTTNHRPLHLRAGARTVWPQKEIQAAAGAGAWKVKCGVAPATRTHYCTSTALHRTRTAHQPNPHSHLRCFHRKAGHCRRAENPCVKNRAPGDLLEPPIHRFVVTGSRVRK